MRVWFRVRGRRIVRVWRRAHVCSLTSMCALVCLSTLRMRMCEAGCAGECGIAHALPGQPGRE
eukprot:6220821-Alexandrium_andersonii.AAC.1